jgi:hypothetical protein
LDDVYTCIAREEDGSECEEDATIEEGIRPKGFPYYFRVRLCGRHWHIMNGTGIIEGWKTT